MSVYSSYLEQAPYIIERFLDHSRPVEAAVVFMRAKYIFDSRDNSNSNLNAYWKSVEEKKSDISKLSRKKLSVKSGEICVLADALAAIAIIDNLNSVNLIHLFLKTRKHLISTIIAGCLDFNMEEVIRVFCDIFEIIQLTFTQSGHLFMHLSSTSSVLPFPLLKSTLLDCGRLGVPIPDPLLESRFLEFFTIRLKGSLIVLDQSFIASLCFTWLWDDCHKQIIHPVNGFYLVDIMVDGHELINAENRIRDTMEGKKGKKILQQSLGWLKTVFGVSKIEDPWRKTRQLFLEDHIDLWTETLEYHFMERMEDILEYQFVDLTKSIGFKDSIGRIVVTYSSQGYPEQIDLVEIEKIIDLLDTCCESALEDFFCFSKSPNASLRLKKLAPVLQQLCYRAMLTIIDDLETEINLIYDVTEPSIVLVYQSLFIGRLLLAMGKQSKQIPLILGSTELWVSKGSSERATSPQISVSCGGSDSPDAILENFKRLTQDLSIKAHDIWISWISKMLSETLFSNLMKHELCLLRSWDETVAAESPSAMKVLVPFMPSQYIISFLGSACKEIYRVGEHLLDGIIMRNLASKLSSKVTETYGFFLKDEPILSRDGVLQILLDLGFLADILSGGDGDSIGNKDISVIFKVKTYYERSEDKRKAVSREDRDHVINGLVQRLDPADWLTFEPYLVEIKKQSYQFHAVNLKFFVQLNPMYTECLGFGVATPFLKSLMQVGSGWSTMKLGFMLTNGQVGRSSAILHSQASGLLSSFTEGKLYV